LYPSTSKLLSAFSWNKEIFELHTIQRTILKGKTCLLNCIIQEDDSRDAKIFVDFCPWCEAGVVVEAAVGKSPLFAVEQLASLEEALCQGMENE
jgi:hypothetical protein